MKRGMPLRTLGAGVADEGVDERLINGPLLLVLILMFVFVAAAGVRGAEGATR